MIFLDTSGAYALADRDDERHELAVKMLEATINSGRQIVTHSYVLVESAALMHRRLGRHTALAFLNEAAGFDVNWVSSEMHAEAVELLAKHEKPDVSLVDIVSFLVMGQEGIAEYLGFDQHFEGEGFRQLELTADG